MARPDWTYREQQTSQGNFPSRESVFAIDSAEQTKIPSAISRETQFIILPDGRILDLIRSTRQPSNLEFLLWHNGQIRSSPHIEHEGEVFIPPKMDPTVVSALRLPTAARPCPGIGDLFRSITNHIDR